MPGIQDFLATPNKVRNPNPGEVGHRSPTRFALVQARHSMILNGFALVAIHAAMTLFSKVLKGRFIYPLSIGAVQAVASISIYTLCFDGRSALGKTNYRSLEFGKCGVNKLLAATVMLLTAPYMTCGVSKYVIKNPISLKTAYMVGGVSFISIIFMDRGGKTKGNGHG